MPTPEDLAPQLMRTDVVYQPGQEAQPSVVREDTIESAFISTLQGLKYGNAVQHILKRIDDDNGNGFFWPPPNARKRSSR